MAAKPTLTPRWANVGGDIVEPTSGKKDVGWVAEEKPPAQYFNWLLNLTYQWLLYLNDGVLDGNHQFLDNVDIDGTLNVDGTVNIEGATTVDDNLTVTGDVTITGDLKHGDQTALVPLMYQPFSTIGTPTDYLTPDVAGILSSSRAYLASYNGDSQRIAVTLPMRQGNRLKSVSAIVSSNEGGRAVDMSIYKHALTGAFATYTVTQLGSTQTTGSSANFQTLTVSGLTETADATENFTAQFEIDGGGGSHRVFAVYMTYDRP